MRKLLLGVAAAVAMTGSALLAAAPASAAVIIVRHHYIPYCVAYPWAPTCHPYWYRWHPVWPHHYYYRHWHYWPARPWLYRR